MGNFIAEDRFTRETLGGVLCHMFNRGVDRRTLVEQEQEGDYLELGRIVGERLRIRRCGGGTAGELANRSVVSTLFIHIWWLSPFRRPNALRRRRGQP